MIATMTTAKSNTPTLEDLKKHAFECGADSAKGGDAQIKFGLQIVAAAYHGTINLDRNRHGMDIDDCTVLSGEYFKGRSGNAVFDAKAGNQRKLIACARTLTKLGGWTKGGMGEPIATTNNLMTHRQTLRKDPTKAKKLDDAFNTLMRFARQQIRADQLITADRFDEFCYRKQNDPASLEDHLDAIRKKALDLKNGKASNGTVQDKSPEINDIINACTKRLTALAQGKAKSGKAA